MSEQSEKWDSQWSELLTHCYGDVEARAEFKTSLLDELKGKMAESRHTEPVAETEDDALWSKFLTQTYVPCTPDPAFKKALLSRLESRQAQMYSMPAEDRTETAIRNILGTSHEPVAPRREFQTRLLENLKERQRTNTTLRVKSRRRAVFFSALTSMAAAAMVIFVVWVSPFSASPASGSLAAKDSTHAVLPDPELIARIPDSAPAPSEAFETVPASYSDDYEVVPAGFNYRVADAFASAALPGSAVGLQNMEIDAGEGWHAMDDSHMAAITPGMRFRSVDGGVGHLGFSDNSMISMAPNTVIAATDEGFAVERGVALVSVPDSSGNPFRLHFSERDIAVEPGTQLALLVEPKENFAEGGAPAPVVMVVEDDATEGGFALARGRNGIAPLFARYLYSLDKFVTPDLPGRPLCDVECQELGKMFKMQMLQQPDIPMASFAGGFGGNGFRRPATTKLTPAGFIRQGSRWVADSYNDEPTVKIRYLSNEYFGLANQRRDLARGLALGPEVIVDAGDDTFYEIYK